MKHELIEPFVTTFLRKKGMSSFIEQYNLTPFELNVLSLRQTLCEKVVSLIRFSMSDTPLASLTSKVRHFYDLDALLSIEQFTKLYFQRCVCVRFDNTDKTRSASL